MLSRFVRHQRVARTVFAAGVPRTAPRWYYPTPTALQKDEDEDEENRIIIPGQADVQTLNAEKFSPEEINRIIEEEDLKLKQKEDEKFVKNWKPGLRKRPLKHSYDLKEFEYEFEPEKHGPRWMPNLDRRCGALAIKVGMMPVYDTWGIRHPCTVLFLDQNVVLGHKTMEKHGYLAVTIAAGERKRKNVGKCVMGQYKPILEEASEEEDPPYLTREFRVSDPSHLPPIGSSLHARHFCPGQRVDCAATSKGKGFQGPMKRHGFSGMPASHGVSLSHRAHGSTGQCQDPGRVFKGKKMAGRMGGTRVTVQNLRVVQVDRGRNLVFVEGAVPGPRGRFVEIRDAVKKPGWGTELVEESYPPVPTFEYEEGVDGSGTAGNTVFMPLSMKDPLASDMDEAA